MNHKKIFLSHIFKFYRNFVLFIYRSIWLSASIRSQEFFHSLL